MKAKSYYLFIRDIKHDLEWSSNELRSFLRSPYFDDLDDLSKDSLNRSKIILDNTIDAINKKIGGYYDSPLCDQ